MYIIGNWSVRPKIEEEGVVNLRAHVGMKEGRAYCFNMAPEEEAVRRVHERAGLPFDSITEVKATTPGDMFFNIE